MPALFLDSLGLSDKITREAGPPPKPQENLDPKQGKGDDDSLWEGVDPNSDYAGGCLPSFLSCGADPDDDDDDNDESEAEEDFTLPITNRGTISKIEVPAKNLKHDGDESSLGSLASGSTAGSTSSSSDSSTSNDSSESGDEDSSLALLCELVEDVLDDQVPKGSKQRHVEDIISGGIAPNDQEKSMTIAVATSNSASDSAPDLATSPLVMTSSIEKERSTRDESREGIGSSQPSGFAEKLRELPKIGLSLRKRSGLSTTSNKSRSMKKLPRRFLGFMKSTKKAAVTGRSNTEYLSSNGVDQEGEEKNLASGIKCTVLVEYCHGDEREQAPQENEEPTNQAVFLSEKMILKPDHRGRLTKQSNLEELIRYADPNDRRNRVLGVSDGFEVVSPSKQQR